MENTSYALHIAIGTLIAVMIISLAVFFWKNVGIMEKSKDDAQETKNRSTFNAEWQAYEKNLMYGSDVLSCLNKAQNNNQKYVYNNYYGQDTENLGKDFRDEYFIDVEVTINSPLCEKIEAYWKDSKGKYRKIVGGVGDTEEYSDTIFDLSSSNHFDFPKVYYYYFKNGNLYQEIENYANIMGIKNNISLYDILKSEGNNKVGMIETNFKAGTYNLLTSEDVVDSTFSTSLENKKESAKLSALISAINLKSQELVNKDTPSSYEEKADWWYCKWTTAANDFKSRKFKCLGVELNENTGYINKISFEEYNKDN